jgi:hypothetical protein
MKLRISVPCFGGLIQAVCAHSIMRLTKELQTLGTSYELDFELHESLVQRARNSLTHRFMKSDCTHMLFIDADIQFRPVDVLGLLQADKEMVCGAYPRKRIMEDNVAAAVRRGEKDPFAHAASFVVNVLPGEPGSKEVTLHADNGCVPILDAATGFLLMRREVFIKMAAAMPEILYYSDAQQNRGEAMHAFFDCAIVDGRYLSEDFLFSRRWQNLGGTVWLFLPAELGHVGTYTYRGNLYSTFLPVGDDGAVIAPAVHKSSEYSLPEDNDPNYAKLMMERYEIAAGWVSGKRIADACSGPGYGMPILSRNQTRYVIGFDRVPENAATAEVRGFGHVDVCDVTTKDFDGFDSVVSLETWEHLPDPIPWFRGFAPSVKEVVISCPCVPTKHVNEHHLADYGYDEMLNIVRAAGWTVREHRRQRDDVSQLHAVRD